MAMNILDLVKSQMDDTFAGAASGVTGLDRERTKSAVGMAIPAVLATIASTASTPRGKSALATALNTQEPGMLSNLSANLASGNQKSLINSGVSMLSSVIGDNKLAGLVKAMGSTAGIGAGETRSLLGLVAPVVMGVLGREQRSGLGLDGVVNTLQNEKSTFIDALPAGLSSSLKSGGLLEGAEDTARAGYDTASSAARRTAEKASRRAGDTAQHATDTTQRVAQKSHSGRWWAIAAGLVALALVLWGVTRDRGEDTQPTVSRPVQPAERPAPAPAQPPAERPPEVAAVAPGQTSNMIVGNVDVRREFTGIVDGLSQTLRGVNDEASAQEAMPRLNELSAEIDELTPIVGQLPSTAKPAFTELARTDIDRLQTEIRRVDSLPDVPDELKESLTTITGKLRGLLG